MTLLIACAPSEVSSLYEGIELIASKGGEYELDAIACKDSEHAGLGTIVCGVPVAFNGEEKTFVVYPGLVGGWNDYEITAFEYELW